MPNDNEAQASDQNISPTVGEVSAQDNNNRPGTIHIATGGGRLNDNSANSPISREENADVIPRVPGLPEDPGITKTVEPPPAEISPEEKEIKIVKKQYKLTPKFNAWVQYFTNKNNPETYGNKTQSAILAYSLDPKTEYAIAGSMGYQNFKKLQSLASVFADHKGVTFDKLMQTAMARAMSSENPEWWDRVMEMTGYKEPKGAQVVVQNNTQNNVQVNGAEAVDFSAKFKQFLENE